LERGRGEGNKDWKNIMACCGKKMTAVKTKPKKETKTKSKVKSKK
jgi:hypothetical protein